MLPLCASVGLLLAAGDRTGWTAGVDTAVRGEAAQLSAPGADAWSSAGVVEATGRLRLSVGDSGAWGALSYSPRLLLRRNISGEIGATGDSLHQAGELYFGTRIARGTVVTSSARADYGLTDYSPLFRVVETTGTPAQSPPVGVTPGTTVGRLPPARFVRTLDLDATVALEQTFSRELRASVAAGFQRGGGVGDDAVQFIPAQSGPHAGGSFAWTVNPEHALSLRAGITQSRFESGRFSTLTEGQAGWSYRFSREWQLATGAGVGYVHAVDQGVTTAVAYPSADVHLRWSVQTRATRIGASGGVATGARIDAISGQPMQATRADVAFELSDRALSFTTNVSAGRVGSGAGAGAEDAAATAQLSWAVDREWALFCGGGVGRATQAFTEGWQSSVWAGFRWNGGGRL